METFWSEAGSRLCLYHDQDDLPAVYITGLKLRLLNFGPQLHSLLCVWFGVEKSKVIGQ